MFRALPMPPFGGGDCDDDRSGRAFSSTTEHRRMGARRSQSSRLGLCGVVAASTLVLLQHLASDGVGPGRPGGSRFETFGPCALMPAPASSGLARTPSVAPDRWPLPGASVEIMPEAVERPLDKYLMKYDDHYKRVVPDWFLQYKTLEQQYLYEGDFSVFVREMTDEGAIVQDVVTGVVGFVPTKMFGPVEPTLGAMVDGARCLKVDMTVIESPSESVLRLQTGIVWEWDEEAGEGYIMPTEEQDAWQMLRVHRRDISWHDSYRVFVGQFVQFETVLHDEVELSPNDEKLASFALRVRSPEVVFSLDDAYVDEQENSDGQIISLLSRGAPMSSINSLNPRIWKRDAPIPPDSGRPLPPKSRLELSEGEAQQRQLQAGEHRVYKNTGFQEQESGLVAQPELSQSQHPALERWASTDTKMSKADSPAWLWDERLDYVEDDIEDYPIVPLEVQRREISSFTERVLSHEVAVQRGDAWMEPAQRQGRRDQKKQRPPGRKIIETMSLKKLKEREDNRKQRKRAWKLRAAGLQREQDE